MVFADKDSIYRRISNYYYLTRPFSHFVFLSLIIILVTVIVGTNVRAFLRINNTTLIEGEIVGVDENNQLQQLSKINPLINTNIQLEKDLTELIYESLVRVDQNGDIIPILADYLEIKPGQLYRFKLKDNLLWHDGLPVTTEDVRATFELIQYLDQDARTSTLYSRAATKLELIIIDDLSFEFKLNSALPTFFEAISFKILPAHLMNDLTPLNINTPDPLLNRHPVGTGPYKLATVTEDAIELIENENYHGDKSAIKNIRFKLFADEATALDALKSGQIHSLTGMSTDRVREVAGLPHINVVPSSIIYNQYWGIYLNLGANGNPLLKDKKVRQALSSAINRELIIDALLGFAAEATGPIPESSFAYSKEVTYGYDKERAEKLLTDAGWVIPDGGTVREKEGKKLSFNLILIDNADRKKIAETVKKDLAEVGVELNVEIKSREQVVNENIIPRVFDMLLYGVQTFIDPDRYELFHSSQIEHPGLNISSYSSTETILTVVENNKTERVPIVDDVLNDGRKIIDPNARKKKYQTFLNAVAEDVPVIFLFHPEESYAVNKRVKGVKLDSISSIEQRFATIKDWSISVD